MKICDFQPVTCCILETVQDSYYWTLATTTILWPLYRTTCISQLSQLRTGRFCWSEVLLHECPWWWQLVHLDLVEDARVLLSSVNCTICILLNTSRKLYTDVPNNDIANDWVTFEVHFRYVKLLEASILKNTVFHHCRSLADRDDSLMNCHCEWLYRLN